ncbi:uncharacterized protein UTRI_10232 [Ustilago trichophora]|uniref:C3H1-type domain-containing protein n=1 Tax=Ustilago trichophora TaxID=86804 RepID=A0A5C3EEM9_9BASI|nr:uncharacterized protein UTRI_10232 [Ustilago trichophora]
MEISAIITPPDSSVPVESLGIVNTPSSPAPAAAPAPESLFACRTCKQPQPASQFQHQRFANKRVVNCLSCRQLVTPNPTVPSSRRPVVPAAPRAAPVPYRLPSCQPTASRVALTAPAATTLPSLAAVATTTPVPAVAGHQPSVPTALPTPAPAATTTTSSLPSEPAVTQSDLAELRQTLQDDLTDTLRELLTSHLSSLAAAPLPTQTSTAGAAAAVTPPAPVAQPIPAGESLAQLTGFPWVAPDIADKVFDDSLSPHDLPKLASPTWVQDAEDTTSFTVNGIVFNKSVSSATSGKQFAKSFPSFTSFWRVWIVYTQLRTYQATDRALGIGLGSFLLHIQELDQVFPWPRVVDYILTVCIKRFGKATSADWLRTDPEAHFSCFQGVQGRSATANQQSSAKRTLSARDDDPRRSQVCFSWNNGRCSGSDKRPCLRQHICSKCKGAHQARGCVAQQDSSPPVKKQA